MPSMNTDTADTAGLAGFLQFIRLACQPRSGNWTRNGAHGPIVTGTPSHHQTRAQAAGALTGAQGQSS
jgi:hypothetical protein